MPIIGQFTDKLAVGGEVIGGAANISEGLNVGLNEVVPDSSTDLEIAFPLTVADVVVFGMESNRDVTIETNDGSSPDDTIVLAAGIPYTWRVGKPDAFLLGTDVVSIFVTNSSGEDATLKIQAIVDPTPA